VPILQWNYGRTVSVYLTPTERTIAEQAARGARNDEIAGIVGLSRRTVEWHLSRVYRKLGLRSRTELAARVAAHADLRISPGPDDSADEQVGPLSETRSHVISESHRKANLSQERR
jgi:DNA-binding CsgD family transcriptional regulator